MACNNFVILLSQRPVQKPEKSKAWKFQEADVKAKSICFFFVLFCFFKHLICKQAQLTPQNLHFNSAAVPVRMYWQVDIYFMWIMASKREQTARSGNWGKNDKKKKIQESDDTWKEKENFDNLRVVYVKLRLTWI